MKRFSIAALLALAGAVGVAAPAAEAKSFGDLYTSCKKDTGVSSAPQQYLVPDGAGGTAVVKLTQEYWSCRNKRTKQDNELVTLTGLVDEAGKVLVPMKYQQVLPFSTRGAVVRNFDFGSKYFTYMVGKGEGKERYDFQRIGMTLPTHGCGDQDPRKQGVAAVIGETFIAPIPGDPKNWQPIGGGRSHVTLFTSEGKARKLEYVGGDDLKPAVQRVGDVLLARWRDDQGVARSGFLDINGNQVAPVLGSARVWSTKGVDGRTYKATGYCDNSVSKDIMIEGPSLDADPSRPWYGPLLTPVASDGQPVPLPPGAVGMFPAIERDPYLNAGKDATRVWAVVYPTASGFEFTLHPGTPAEALALAPTAPRYVNYGRTGRYDLIVAQSASDRLWRTWTYGSSETFGVAAATFEEAGSSAVNILLAQAAANQAEREAAKAAEQARIRAEAEKQLAAYRASIDAMSGSQLCTIAMPTTLGADYMARWLDACAGTRLGMYDLSTAEAAGVASDTITRARQAWIANAPQREREAAWAKAAELERLKGNSSYIPGQWSSAIQAAGNAWAAAINQSSENWLKQRQDQYIADWQRSQRAY
jgi:hypothetical protein